MYLDLFISKYQRMIGLARYTEALKEYLANQGIEYTTIEPAYPALIRLADTLARPFGYDVHEFFNTYPISAHFRNGSIKHFTTQMMALLFSIQPDLEKVVISVHDIIPYMMRDDPEQNVYHHFYDRWIDNQAMQNIRKADRILVVSNFTGRMLIEKLDCPQDKIRVVHNAVDHEVFHPILKTDDVCARYGLSKEYRYLLYVGSENPRKNLYRLIQAFGEIKRKMPEVKLIKVGKPEYLQQYALLKYQIHSAGLDEDVLWLGSVPNDDLAGLYSAVDAFVFPSLYEGFGLPPLEAMACGTPVICSDTTSLPEVVGEAAVTVNPYDTDSWVAAIERVLCDDDLQKELRSRGLARAAQFTWDRTIQQTIEVYDEVDRI